MIHKKKAVSMVLLLLLLCFSMAGCSETGSEGIEVKNDDAVMKVPEKQTMSASLLEMNKMLGAGETGAGSDDIRERIADTQWSSLTQINGENIQKAFFFWNDGSGRYRKMNVSDGQKVLEGRALTWEVKDQKIEVSFLDNNDKLEPEITDNTMNVSYGEEELVLDRNGDDYIIQGGEYSFSELEGRWKMIYCVSSSDDSNLVNAGVNSFMEFAGDGKMRFQFFFEYVQMYVPEGEYHLCDGPMMDDILNQAWYCNLEDVNTYSEENGKCYCDFTLYGDRIIARISMDGDNVSYLGLLEKSEE